MEKNKKLEKLKEGLIDMSKQIRGELNPTLSDNQQLKEPNFRRWILVNTLIDGIEKNLESDSGFNNFLLFVNNENKTLDELVDQYDLKVVVGEQDQLSYELVVKENG